MWKFVEMFRESRVPLKRTLGQQLKPLNENKEELSLWEWK